MTIDEIFRQFKEKRRCEVRESTMAAYAQAYKNYIQPIFGHLEPDEITSGILQNWIDGQHGSPHTVRDRYRTLMTILNWYRRSMDMPMMQYKVKLPQNIRKELETYSKAEQKKIVEYIMSHPGIREFGILLCLSTGMRIGELCGLQWQDLDLQQGELHVRRTIERIYDAELRNTKLIVGPPKTISSRRTIPIPKKLLQILKKCNALTKPEYYLLSGTEKPIEPRGYRDFYNELLSKAGVRRLKFHGLRHSFATLLVESKADIKTVSSILGHSGVEITMDIYVHPTTESKRAQMHKAFKGIL